MNDVYFTKGNVTALRLMRDDDSDYRLMSKWLSDERVLEFYEGRDNPFSLDKIHEKYGARALGLDRVTPCIIEYEGRSIGYVQYYPLNEAEASECGLETIDEVFGVDLFIGESEHWGHGIGTDALSALVGYLIDTRNASIVTIDPYVSNTRAIRSYEKCGFVKSKILPKHELHEGEYRDSWLMTIERARTN